MWVTTDYKGDEQIWYSKEEYESTQGKLDKSQEVLYNIEEHLKERHDWVAVQKIGEEIEKWKKSLNVKSAE